MIKPIFTKNGGAYHDFEVTSEGMQLKIDGTHYTVRNRELLTNYVEEMTTITVTELDENMEEVQVAKQVPTGVKIPLEGAIIDIAAGYDYVVYLTNLGIEVLYKAEGEEFGQLEGELIDRLAWFTVPVECTTLDDVEINVVEVVEE